MAARALVSSDLELVRLQRAIRELLEAVQHTHAAMPNSGSLSELEGWTELNGRPSRLAASEDDLVLISCLYGPTGSGKSTLFNLLTGINTPASDRFRPCSYNAMLAAPASWAKPDLLESIFPGYQARLLSTSEELRDPNISPNTLFYAPVDPKRARTSRMLLADVPDFDSIETANWEKAERMMRHADIIFFVVYTESYKNREVISQLVRCCRRAGRLAFLLNKTRSKDQAESIRRDLLEYCASTDDFPFDERRQDGRTLAEFLAGSPFYHCPFTFENIEFESIAGLSDAPPFESLISGEEARRIVLASVAQSCVLGIHGARALAAKAEARLEGLHAQLAESRRLLTTNAQYVSGTIFPQGRLISIVIDVARENRPLYLRALSAPIAWLSKGMVGALKTIRAQIESNQSRFRNLADLEQERMQVTVERVLDEVRRSSRLPHPGAAEAKRAADQYFSQPLPPPAREWDQSVREGALEWCKNHKMRTSLLGALTDLLTIMGGSAIAVDFLFGGGMGSLGVVAAAGMGSTGAGIALSVMEQFGLRSVAEKADAAWRATRTEQLAEDMETRLLGPMFLDALKTEAEQLESARIIECREAADALESIVGRLQ